MINYETIDSSIGQNWYTLDPNLQDRVRSDTPADDLAWSHDKLTEFGALAGGDVARNADVIDANPPQLRAFDRWGENLGEIVHHPASIDSKKKLWSIGYVSGFAADEHDRGRPAPGVVRFGASYLLSQADIGMVCSLGMTSGVAGLVDSYAPPDLRDDLLATLRSGDFEAGSDGSMFLTERLGGSDLGRTIRCTARDIGDGRVLLNGEKWFCSNIDGAAIVILARPEGATEGTAPLGLYLVPRYVEDGSRNTYVMRRLKDKLGTRSVPTGEVEFTDTLGYALRPRSAETGVPSDFDAGGLNRMMEMVNGSRFGVALMGLGIARRSLLEALIWAHHREVKGRLLVDLPLMREQLVDLLVELEGAFALGFEAAAAGQGDDGTRLRRIVIPAAKVRLCRLGIDAASQCIEIVGGNGYNEDWGLTRQLRDAQCNPIWEGSENICALDVLRAVRRDQAHEAALARIDRALDRARDGGPAFLAPEIAAIGDARKELAMRTERIDSVDINRTHATALRLTDLFNRTLSSALLAERGADSMRSALVAARFVRRNLRPEACWDDQIAAFAGRDMLAYAEIEADDAARAAA